ncbi:response regulator [Enterobacter wuhouensis]|uniref:response regulator n=1 Tax=Enterobacter wuhouensis TaxID=2529381 RepID=UPI0035264811
MIKSDFMYRSLDKQKILVVDDHSFQRQVIRYQINSLGYDYQNIFEAESGVEALFLCRLHHFNTIFCDLLMPGMDGMSLLRHLSVMRYAGSFIISSGTDTDVIDSVLRTGKAYGLNMAGAVPKPSLVSQIQELLLKCQEPIQVQNSHAVLSDASKEIHQAPDPGDSIPWYQSKVSFKACEWLNTLALARWCNPKNGIFPPAAFIALPEQIGLINQLTATMILKPIRCVHLWGKKSFKRSILSIFFQCTLV